jgi:hypothetical protein
MNSLEPFTIGRHGYPLLLQTGETANGVEHLIDRQHPHDLFMELAASYSISSERNAAFVYAGLPGEPALGPPTFMHRFSGMDIPESPITHHWLDSSHITFGVLTAGLVLADLKLEASRFTGREPDQHRLDIEEPHLDSHSFRATWNPRPSTSLQASYGRIESPEQLAPDVDVDRTTISAAWQRQGSGSQWGSMLAWGRNRAHPGHILDAWLLESTLRWRDRHTAFTRIERVEKDELFEESDPRAGRVFTVGRIGAGYIVDFLHAPEHIGGLGVSGSISLVPAALEDDYGDMPISGLFFFRLAVR